MNVNVSVICINYKQSLFRIILNIHQNSKFHKKKKKKSLKFDNSYLIHILIQDLRFESTFNKYHSTTPLATKF